MKKPGKCLIINNFKFVDKEGNVEIYGTQNDSNLVAKLFDYLNFEVTIENNNTIKNMKDNIDNFKANHNNYDAFAVVLMTRGNQDKIFGVDNANGVLCLLINLKLYMVHIN